MTLDELFYLVRSKHLRWHGMYQEAHIPTPVGAHQGETYGASTWNVRFIGEPSESFMAYGAGLSLEDAIKAGIADAERCRAWRPHPRDYPQGTLSTLGGHAGRGQVGASRTSAHDLLKELGLTKEELLEAIASLPKESSK